MDGASDEQPARTCKDSAGATGLSPAQAVPPRT